MKLLFLTRQTDMYLYRDELARPEGHAKPKKKECFVAPHTRWSARPFACRPWPKIACKRRSESRPPLARVPRRARSFRRIRSSPTQIINKTRNVTEMPVKSSTAPPCSPRPPASPSFPCPYWPAASRTHASQAAICARPKARISASTLSTAACNRISDRCRPNSILSIFKFTS